MKRFGCKGLAAVMSLVLFFAVFSPSPVYAAWTMGSVGRYTYDNASRYNVGGTIIDQRIEGIDISWVSGNVNVEYWDGSSIEVSETFVDGGSPRNDSTLLRWRIKDGCLYVKYAKSGISVKATAKDLSILIPRGMTLDELEIDTVSANSWIGKTDAIESIRSFEYDTVSGYLEAHIANAYEIEIDAVSGDSSLVLGMCPSEIDGDTVSGFISVVLPENSLYAVEFESVSGRISSPVVNGTGNVRYRPTGAKSNFEFETVSGNVTIR